MKSTKIKRAGEINMRGRPKLTMTTRRQQVLAAYEAEAMGGVYPTLARLARRVGLYDYRNARRVVKDLQAMGRLTQAIPHP